MKKYSKLILSILFLTLAAASLPSVSPANIPITTDSRIKTFVFNENEVYRLTVHFGYQSNIEFAKNEEIETISMGNSYSWKITPVERRLFIKALEGDAHTNMTVITNKRTYQFELQSRNPDDGLDEELVYVVRFFYPDKSFDTPRPKVDTKRFLPDNISSPKNKINFNYSLTGPDSIAPVKVFDDGKSTYLKFPNNNATVPHIFYLGDAGNQVRATFKRDGEYIVVGRIFKKLSLKMGNESVIVYNDKLTGAF